MTQNWIAPAGVRVPDFIICGAMKCGTSTLHALLHKHPNVFVPEREINFFDLDDLFQHADFYIPGNGRWYWPDISQSPQDYWDWYQDFFRGAPSDCLLGEDSTCYLPSLRAAQRISLQQKPIKLIVCLRQPTDRAYSQYWHMLRTGRAIFSFEDTIRFMPEAVIERSQFLPQIERLLSHIPKTRVFFFVLEEFLANKQATISRLSQFLSIDESLFPADALDTHTNRARLPRSIRLQTFRNRLFREFGNQTYTRNLPFSAQISEKRIPIFARLFDRLHSSANPSKPRPAPQMNPATQVFLDRYFRRELVGLSDLIGVDIDDRWFTNRINKQ